MRRDFILALVSFRDAELRRKALDGFIAGDLDPNELFLLAINLQKDTDGGDLVLRWLMENHDALAAQLPPFLRTFLPLLAGGCSAERLAKAQAFFAQEEHRVAGTERQLAQVAGQVEDCVRLSQREGAAVARYLSR